MLKKIKGVLYIVSAPSGAGKTTLCKKAVAGIDNLRQSVSFTTRQPRDREVRDEDYSFINEKKFRQMIAQGDFVEWAEVHGNLYGTSRKRLEKLLDGGFDVLLDIDTQGARQIRESCSGGVFIFILPPSMETLRARLTKRGSNSEEDMQRRLKRAVYEIQDYNKYDYVIVNDKLKDSFKRLESIIIAERLRHNKMDPAFIRKILQ